MKIERYTNELRQKGEWKYILLIIAVIILYTSGLSYVGWNPTISGWIKNGISIVLLLFLVLHFPKSNNYNFKKDVLLLMFIPFLSSINTNMLYGQSYFDSVRALLPNITWIFYFVLHKYKVKESAILKSFLIISLLIVGIQIIQQFTFPNAYFGVASEDSLVETGMNDIAEQRNGLWRFRMGNNGYFTCVILFALLMWVRKKWSNSIIFLIALMFVSVYLTLTRQVIGACLLTVFFSFFLGKKSGGMGKVLIFGIVLVGLLYSYSDVLFGSLAQQTNEDVNDSNIRVLAATYFWSESISSPEIFILGHGTPSGSGNFRNLIEQLQTVMHFYTSDVGVVGEIYTYGIIYVFLCYRLLWRLFFKFRKEIPTYIRLFVIFSSVMSIMIFPMYGPVYYLVWIALMYIADLHINKKQTNIRKPISYGSV